MGLKEDIVGYVGNVVDVSYDISDAYSVPSRESLTFRPAAKKIYVRALYIDLRKSKWLLGEYERSLIS